MPKPTSLPRWTDVTSGNRLEPTSGLKDTGWVAGQRPAAKHMNWLLYTIYSWLLWLDGQIGTDIAAQAWAWTGNQTWAGTAQFNGATTLNGNVEFGAAGLVTAYPVFTFKDDIIMDTGANVVVSATGLGDFNGDIDVAGNIKFSTARPRYIPGMAITEYDGDWTTGAGFGYIDSAVAPPSRVRLGLDLEFGETVTISVDLKHTDATAGNMTVAVYNMSGSGSITLLNTQASAASAVQQTVVGLTNHVVLNGYSYWVEISSSGGTAQTRTIYQVIVSRKRV